MHTWRARTYTHTLFIQRSRWDKPLDRASHMCWVGPSHRNNKSSHSAKTVVGTTQALEATTTVPSVDATSDGQKSGRSGAVAVGTNPCATGEWPSRQDLANRYPGVLVASWSLLLPHHTCHSAAYAVANHFFDSFCEQYLVVWPASLHLSHNLVLTPPSPSRVSIWPRIRQTFRGTGHILPMARLRCSFNGLLP